MIDIYQEFRHILKELERTQLENIELRGKMAVCQDSYDIIRELQYQLEEMQKRAEKAERKLVNFRANLERMFGE